MKKKIYLTISILCFAIGLGIILYPIVYDLVKEKDRADLSYTYNEEVTNLSNEKIKELEDKMEEYNSLLWKQQNGEGKVNKDLYWGTQIGSSGVMGYLSIPKLDIKNMPFFHGTSPVVLMKSLGHIDYTSIPIGGNNTHAFITGHAGLSNQVLFTNLSQLSKGDYFYINILDKQLKYEVVTKEEVEPTDIAKTRIVKDKDLVTLQTCTPIDMNSHRLLITGTRVDNDINDFRNEIKNTKKKSYLTYNQKAGFIVLGAVLLLIIINFVFKRRKLNEEE